MSTFKEGDSRGYVDINVSF